MQDTVVTSNQPGLSALLAMVAAASAAGDLLMSSSRLVDALLDARGEVEAHVVVTVDDALRSCAHRHVVPTDEVVEMVAAITAGQAQSAEPV